MNITKIHNHEPDSNLGSLLDQIKQSISSLEGHSLFQQAISNINESENILAHAFLNGKSIENFNTGTFKNASESFENIHYSIRIANIQKTSTGVQDICNLIYQKLRLATTCNLYFTPSNQSNCFDYHVDMQESIVLQLVGKKTWSFPQEVDETFKTIPFGTIPSPFHVDHQKEIILQQNDILYVGRNIIHKAENTSPGPSIHLTFALQKMNAVGFVLLLTQEIEKKLNLNLLINNYPEKEKCIEIIEQYKNALNELNPDVLSDLFFKESMSRELKTLKKGRSY